MIIKITEKNQPLLASESGFVVFLSLDIEGSTRGKLEHPDLWMLKYCHFFEKVRWFFKYECDIPNTYIWKELGDEILIAFFPQSIDDLNKIIQVSVEAATTKTVYKEPLTEIGLDYKTMLFCSGYCEPKPFSSYGIDQGIEYRSDKPEFQESFNSLYNNHRITQTVQSTGVSIHNSQPSSCRINSLKEYDFIGPDIDIGFRIGKHARTGRLVVSDKIAYLCCCLFHEKFGFVIEGMEELKGVWGGRRYPIIYYNDEESGNSVVDELRGIYNKERDILRNMDKFVGKTCGERLLYINNFIGTGIQPNLR